jgi:hypothetical protein
MRRETVHWPGRLREGFHFDGNGVNQDLIRHEQVRRNSEFGTSGGFEFPDERASVLYWNEWHKRRLRLRVR